MTTETRKTSKDVAALRTAIVCVGLSGVCLAFFVLGSGGDKIASAVCAGAGVLVALLGVTNWPAARMSRPRRIFAYWALAALLVLELMVPVNYVGARRHLRWDWTEGNIRSLSEKSLAVLHRVDKPLHVTTFFVHRNPLQGPVFGVVKDLLNEYQRRNKNIIIEHIDPATEGERMMALSKELKLQDVSQMASVVFQYGSARLDVPMWKLLPRPLPGAEEEENPNPEQMAFHGEEEFTSAILAVTEPQRKEIWFTTGHGELSPDKELAEIAGELRRDNFRVEKLPNLSEGIPENCTVLVILRPNPKTPFNDREVEHVAQYLEREGGKLLFAESGGGFSGLEQLLGDFGINVGRDYIIDQSSGRTTLSAPVYAVPGNPVSGNLREYAMRFDVARSVEAAQALPAMMAPPRRGAVNVLMTGSKAWAEGDVEGLESGKFPSFDPKTDRRGPLGVAAVHEQSRRLPNGEELPKEMPVTKIVAVGSGDFMIGRQTSAYYEEPPEANILFFFNAVHWLAEEEQLITIPPKRFDYRPMDKLTKASERGVFWVSTVGLPAFCLALGGIIWLVRRRS